MAVQEVRFGVTTALKRKKVRTLHLWSVARSSEVISLFLEDWEVGRVVLS